MPVRNTRAGRPSGATRTSAQAVKPKTAVRPSRKTPVTSYASKEPTPYHKAFASWIVKEVGYKPSEALNAREAFLMGVSIATAARNAFNSSDFIEEWRQRTGETKRGPKPKDEAEDAYEEESYDTDEDGDFEDEVLDEDSWDEEDEDSDTDDGWDGEEWVGEEEKVSAPAPRRGRPAAKTAAAPAKRTTASKATPARKAAPAKATDRTGSRRPTAPKDEDYVF